MNRVALEELIRELGSEAQTLENLGHLTHTSAETSRASMRGSAERIREMRAEMEKALNG